PFTSAWKRGLAIGTNGGSRFTRQDAKPRNGDLGVRPSSAVIWNKDRPERSIPSRQRNQGTPLEKRREIEGAIEAILERPRFLPLERRLGRALDDRAEIKREL